MTPNATKLVSLKADGGSITATVEGSYEDGNSLSNITIMGVSSAPSSSIMFNDEKVGSGTYVAGSETFVIGGLDKATSGGAWVADWHLTYSKS